ncbi:MAG: SDR family oxidoreductase [Solirubrobacterales bacterium]|nr:SDR family oxidoreductase [Solirubrobacterales bacterium]MBV9942024.1 SDR family oxidoreductase [Solirubrobacterales bacterium]
MTVLLTGATGFVGMELVARYLERTDRNLVAIIRASSDAAARARLDGVLGNLFGYRAGRYGGRVTAVAGELSAPRLGLSRARWERLAAETETIVHGAASVSFGLPLNEARAINLEGTRRMLELAARGRELGVLEHYAHISTAYVAGTHAGLFSERDFDLGQRFHNSYEQSKFEAEQLVRSWPEVPFTILRPSIVVGDRNSGWTAAFNVLYWPLRALARGIFPAVPASPSSPVDVVSIDYVADAIHELCERPGDTGQTYHLTAGPNASTMGEIVSFASGYFHRPGPKLVPPAEFAEVADGVTKSALEEGSVYFPYFSVAATFDDAFTRARLEPAGISVSPLRDYLGRLLDFATRSRWGKRPIARAEALTT